MYHEFMICDIPAMVGSPSLISSRELVRGVSIDSRTTCPGQIFFALKGQHTDGHAFSTDAIEHGACGVIVQRSTGVSSEIMVDDTLQALGLFAKRYRQVASSHRLRTIAITGTNGKTTVKRMISAILSEQHEVLSSHGNYNSLIGLPLAMLELGSHHDYLVVEMGTSSPGEIAQLCEIARPDIGVITLVGPGHLKDLKSLQGIQKEKLSLITALPSHGHGFVGEGVGDVRGMNITTVDRVQMLNVDIHECGSSFRFQGKEYRTPLLGRANVYNCLIALFVTQFLEIPYEAQKRALAHVSPEPGRLEPIYKSEFLLLNDTYNANPVSMRAAIEFASTLNRSCIFIFGDMLELGVHAKHLHQEIGAIARNNCRILVSYGSFAQYYEGTHFEDKSELVRYVLSHITGNECILVKASRGMHFEDIVNALVEEL